MSIVFINNSTETFTPTQSGALATIIYECCQIAWQKGEKPLVITRSDSAAPFNWESALFIDYPRIPVGQLGILIGRADRKLFGWRNMRQREYANRIIAALKRTGAHKNPLILQNDPEMACVIRHHFPDAYIIHWFQNQHGAKDNFRRRFGGAVNVVAAVSGFTARWIENHYELAKDSVHVVHNGVNPDTFVPSRRRDDEKPVINFVGRTGIEKAPDLVLKACIELAKQTKCFRVQLLGANHWGRLEVDDYQRQLSALADQLSAAGIELRRPGHISRSALPAELQKAQIHVVPSRWDEPFGMATVEGMACGLATIASRTGGTPEVVGDAGILFERDNITELTGHLARFIEDEPFRRHQADLGRRRAETFTWSRTWNSLRALTKEAQEHKR